MKWEGAPTWDEYFTGLAHPSVKRSKDPSIQAGAVVVSSGHRVASIDYNGFPGGCSDDEFPQDREGDFGNTRYPYVVHTELDAILNNRHGLKGYSIYVSLFPCDEYAKATIQSRISRIVYEPDKYACTEGTITGKQMLRSAGIELV